MFNEVKLKLSFLASFELSMEIWKFIIADFCSFLINLTSAKLKTFMWVEILIGCQVQKNLWYLETDSSEFLLNCIVLLPSMEKQQNTNPTLILVYKLINF